MCNVPLETAVHVLGKTGFCQKMNGMKTIDTMPRLQVASGSYVVTEPPNPGGALLGPLSREDLVLILVDVHNGKKDK